MCVGRDPAGLLQVPGDSVDGREVEKMAGKRGKEVKIVSCLATDFYDSCHLGDQLPF